MTNNILTDHPLKSLTWMKVGGSADYYSEVETKEELQEAFHFALEKDLPVIYIGQGSNMIIPDEGSSEVITPPEDASEQITPVDDSTT